MDKLYLNSYGKEKIILNKHDHRKEEVPLHTHNFVEIVYIEEGAGNHHIEQELYPVKMGDISIINTWMSHTFEALPGHSLKVVNVLIDPDFLDSRIRVSSDGKFDSVFFSHYINNRNYTFTDDMALKNRDSQFVADIFDIMFSEYSLKSYNYQIILESYLKILICKLLNLIIHDVSDTNNRHKVIIDKSIHYLKKNYAKELDLAEFSKSLYISQKHLMRIFKQYNNMTILQFVQKLRIEQAIHLLHMTDLCIDDIADSVGYHDIGFFNTLFRRFVGINPGQYRKKVIFNYYGANITRGVQNGSIIFPDKEYEEDKQL